MKTDSIPSSYCLGYPLSKLDQRSFLKNELASSISSGDGGVIYLNCSKESGVDES